jgi:hypothetical protein
MRRSHQGQPETLANLLEHRSCMYGATPDVADPTMPLRQALELALSHAAQAEQRIAELHHKQHALEHEGMHDRAAAVDKDIAQLRRSLVQIELYVRTVQQTLSEDDGSAT